MVVANSAAQLDRCHTGVGLYVDSGRRQSCDAAGREGSQRDLLRTCRRYAQSDRVSPFTTHTGVVGHRKAVVPGPKAGMQCAYLEAVEVRKSSTWHFASFGSTQTIRELLDKLFDLVIRQIQRVPVRTDGYYANGRAIEPSVESILLNRVNSAVRHLSPPTPAINGRQLRSYPGPSSLCL